MNCQLAVVYIQALNAFQDFLGLEGLKAVVGGHSKRGRSVFKAKIEGNAKIQVVKAWYVYTDDPAWRDLMWYHLLMRKVGDHYEAALTGKIPDAFMVEVGDIAMGFPG